MNWPWQHAFARAVLARLRESSPIRVGELGGDRFIEPWTIELRDPLIFDRVSVRFSLSEQPCAHISLPATWEDLCSTRHVRIATPLSTDLRPVFRFVFTQPWSLNSNWRQ